MSTSTRRTSSSARHTIHRHQHHVGWDNSIAPVLAVAPGEAVEFDTVDSSGGQLTARLAHKKLSGLKHMGLKDLVSVQKKALPQAIMGSL